MSSTDFLSWDRLVLEGETLYTYMINNYDKMFDGEKTIKHFGIEIGSLGLQDYVDEILENYYTGIQEELIVWLKKEKDDNRLFENKNWNTFRDPDILLWMFLGYRKMFQYKHYIFQISLNTRCGYVLDDDCKYCTGKEHHSCFGLVLYGWKDEKYENLQPNNRIAILDDYLMPEPVWMYEINWIREQQEDELRNLAHQQRIIELQSLKEIKREEERLLRIPLTILDDNAIPESDWMNEITWVDK